MTNCENFDDGLTKVAPKGEFKSGELKTLRDLVGITDECDKGKEIEDCLFSGEELKAEAVSRAKEWKKNMECAKFDSNNYYYNLGRMEAEMFANNLTEDDLK